MVTGVPDPPIFSQFFEFDFSNSAFSMSGPNRFAASSQFDLPHRLVIRNVKTHRPKRGSSAAAIPNHPASHFSRYWALSTFFQVFLKMCVVSPAPLTFISIDNKTVWSLLKACYNG